MFRILCSPLLEISISSREINKDMLIYTCQETSKTVELHRCRWELGLKCLNFSFIKETQILFHCYPTAVWELQVMKSICGFLSQFVWGTKTITNTWPCSPSRATLSPSGWDTFSCLKRAAASQSSGFLCGSKGKKAHTSADDELTIFWMEDSDSGAAQVAIFTSTEVTLQNVSKVLMEAWTSLTINSI